MDTVMEFFTAVVYAGFALLLVSIGAIVACATFYGIQSVIEDRKSKKNKKGKK